MGWVGFCVHEMYPKAPFTLAEILLATYWRPLATEGNMRKLFCFIQITPSTQLVIRYIKSIVIAFPTLAEHALVDILDSEFYQYIHRNRNRNRTYKFCHNFAYLNKAW